MKRAIDILCAGELLVEMSTAEFARTLDEASLFKRTPAGSAAQLSMNLARLGYRSMLIAAAGKDAMGTVLKNYVTRLGVDTSHIAQVDDPTTLLLQLRSEEGTSLQIYRGADSMIALRQFPYSRFEDIAIFHTTCFALSKLPAQRVLLDAAEKAFRARCLLSLDVNYLPLVWAERREAQRMVAEYCRLNPVIKISDKEWARLYDEQNPTPEAVLDHFLKMGAAEVCYTLGADGCWVADTLGRCYVTARPVEVKETVGVGDAFWAGYLAARLDGYALEQRAIAGRRLAEIKLGRLGPLPDKLQRKELFDDFEE